MKIAHAIGLTSIIVLCATQRWALATTYYVDPAGSDTNTGTSTSQPWKTLSKVNTSTFVAGDSVLFKRGQAWSGQLAPCSNSCSGSSPSNTIKVDAYGTGSTPIINGSGSTPATVYLRNQNYWEVRNLEITNNTAMHGQVAYWGFEAMCDMNNLGNSDRTCHHIYVGSNYIHDVDGLMVAASGGITVEYNSNAVNNLGQPAPNVYDDVTIDSNTITGVDWLGILVSIYSGPGNIVCAYGPTYDCSNSKPKATNVVLENNVITCTGGFGIQDITTSGSVVQYNTISLAGRSAFVGTGCSSTSGTWGSPQLSGVLTAATVNATLQYNEVYDTQTGGDAEAFDADWGSVSDHIQYNYTHGNAGGFLLMWESHNEAFCTNQPACTDFSCDSETTYLDDLIARWNISVNDGSFGGGLINLCGSGRDQRWWLYCDINAANNMLAQSPYGANPPDIMNNTFYTNASQSPHIVSQCVGAATQVVGRAGDAWYFYNNIVYPTHSPRGRCSNSRNSLCYTNSDCRFGSSCTNTDSFLNMLGGVDYPSGARDGSAVFDANTYNGGFMPVGSEIKGATDYYEDPLLLAPMAQGVGGEFPANGRSYLRMQLRTGSPALSTVHSGYNSGFLGSVDFWGNTVSSSGAVNRGAYNGSGVSITVDATSGWFTPASSSEWTSLLSGSGIANPSSLWLAQQPSGSLADSIGSRAFAPSGSPAYQQAVTGWSRQSVKPRTATSDNFAATGVDISTTSDLLLLVVHVNAAPATQGALIRMASSGTDEVDINAGGFLVARDQSVSVTGTVLSTNRTFVLVMKIDRSIPQMVVYNDVSETLKPTWTAPASSTSFYIGDGGLWPDASVLYAAYWTGTSAQLSDTQVATLINRIHKGS